MPEGPAKPTGTSRYETEMPWTVNKGLKGRKQQSQIELSRRGQVQSGDRGIAFTRTLDEGGPAAPYSDLPDWTLYAPGIDIQLYKQLCTEDCGVVRPLPSTNHVVKLPPQEDLGIPRPFICVICGSGFTGPYHAADHFKTCVRENGNPKGFHWFDSESIMEYYRVRSNPGSNTWG